MKTEEEEVVEGKNGTESPHILVEMITVSK